MKKLALKSITALFTVAVMFVSLMSVTAFADELESPVLDESAFTCAIRQTTITKYFTVYNENGIPTVETVAAGAGYIFNIYAYVDEQLTLIAQIETDESGSFDLAKVPEVYEYMGFTDDNLHPESAITKTVYIVDAESLENPEAVSVADIVDEGYLNSNNSYDMLTETTLTIDGVEVPALYYSFNNFYHVNLSGWRVGNSRGDAQFTIRGEGDVAVASGNWASEWGVHIQGDRYFPNNGQTYYFRYSCTDGLFKYEFSTDENFENKYELSTTLNGAANEFTTVLLWMRLPYGFTVDGVVEGYNFTCGGREGGYYAQANYPYMSPLEEDNFSISGALTFSYDPDKLSELTNLNGNECVNYQLKALYLPECSASFISTSELPEEPEEEPEEPEEEPEEPEEEPEEPEEEPEEPEEEPEEPEEEPEKPIRDPMSDVVEAPDTGDSRTVAVPMIMLLLSISAIALTLLCSKKHSA